jgi:uncharacterized protein YjiS (DUF1127 family)
MTAHILENHRSAEDAEFASPIEMSLRRIAGGAGRWLLQALCSPRTDLSEFSDGQLRDIGLTRVDVDPFR